MAWQNFSLLLVAIFLPGCMPHLINASQISRPNKDIRMNVDKQSVSFVCPEIPKCPDLNCPTCPRCSDYKCPTCPLACPNCPTCPLECPQCPSCPQCPDPSVWTQLLKCPDVQANACPEVTTSCQEDSTTTSPASKPTQPQENLDQLLVNHLLNGGGWITFQRRVKGDVDFYKGWEEYKKGFGNVRHGDFWLGNDVIHRLTSKGVCELRIDLTFGGKDYYALYSDFKVAGEDDNYRMTVEAYFSGTAGDSLINTHNGMQFTTKDKDNDEHEERNCSEIYRGGWWYRSCHSSNLNGQWRATNNKGLRWYSVTGTDGATSTEMKLRILV